MKLPEKIDSAVCPFYHYTFENITLGEEPLYFVCKAFTGADTDKYWCPCKQNRKKIDDEC